MPRLLDLFCGAGGASMGYHRAGWEVVGVDIRPQRRYPFEFHQADALAVLRGEVASIDLAAFDAVHASPPCQRFSAGTRGHGGKHRAKWPDLVAPTRDLLAATSLPYVMENVQGAPLRDPFTLCGTAFAAVTWDERSGRYLYLKRHRGFESNRLFMGVPECRCAEYRRLPNYEVGGVYRGGSNDLTHARTVWHGGYTPPVAVQRRLMSIDWMSGDELAESIPPFYTEWIGERLHVGR